MTTKGQGTDEGEIGAKLLRLKVKAVTVLKPEYDNDTISREVSRHIGELMAYVDSVSSTAISGGAEAAICTGKRRFSSAPQAIKPSKQESPSSPDDSEQALLDILTQFVRMRNELRSD